MLSLTLVVDLLVVLWDRLLGGGRPKWLWIGSFFTTEGKTLDEVENLANNDFDDTLYGFPLVK